MDFHFNLTKYLNQKLVEKKGKWNTRSIVKQKGYVNK